MKKFCLFVSVSILVIMFITIIITMAQSKSSWIYYNCNGFEYEFVKVKRPDTIAKRKLAFKKYYCKVYYIVDHLDNIQEHAMGRLYIRGIIK